MPNIVKAGPGWAATCRLRARPPGQRSSRLRMRAVRREEAHVVKLAEVDDVSPPVAGAVVSKPRMMSTAGSWLEVAP